MATSTQRRKFFFTFVVNISLIFREDWNFFFRKWLLSDQSNVARILGVRNQKSM